MSDDVIPAQAGIQSGQYALKHCYDWFSGMSIAEKNAMQKPSEKDLISTYKRLAEERGGTPIGERVFKNETGFSHHYWKGIYWRSWSAFQEAAGYAPNSATEKIPDDTLLQRFADLALELKALPIEADLVLKKKRDETFPSKQPFRRWGNREALLAKVAEFCEGKPLYAQVLAMYGHGTEKKRVQQLNKNDVKGFVYLLRSGKNYKIGRTNAIGRRLYDLSIQLPEKPDTVHVIETDDPEGIEQYWHRRFATKRRGGEWFVLTADDVAAFKRRQFQ